MNLTYNGLYDYSDIVTFSDIPNIVQVSENISGTKATLTISFNETNWGYIYTQVRTDGQFYFTFLAETITNTMDINMARNKQFYIANTAKATAFFFAQALRNCATVAVDYNVVQNGTNIYVISKTIGVKFDKLSADLLVTNIPNMVMTYTSTDGMASSDLYGSKINLDIYNSLTDYSDNYICTLTKSFSGNKCAFDISPITSTFSEYGKTSSYYVKASYITDKGQYGDIGTVKGKTTIGYEANMSDKYLWDTNIRILANNRRNDEPIKLYTYEPKINYTVLNSKGMFIEKIVVYNSSDDIIDQWQVTVNKLADFEIYDRLVNIPQNTFKNAYKIEISTDNTDKVTYDVIKPLKATEGSQRVLWRNEYGGISFFDFTGERTESDSVDIETYEKNILDYYDNDEYEGKRIYSIDYSKEVTLSSHLMEKNGTYIFNSLMNSKRVWTIINDKTYYIIPKSIEVSENENFDGIYKCRFKYEYSHLK